MCIACLMVSMPNIQAWRTHVLGLGGVITGVVFLGNALKPLSVIFSNKLSFDVF